MSVTDHPWRIKMLFDGQCPVCKTEVALLRKRNRDGLIAFEDIADPAFDPSVYGLTLPQVVGSMHAVRADGSILEGVDVFAEIYDIVGWKLPAWLIRFPVTRPVMKLGYRAFAAIRPRFSRFDSKACATDRCRI
jgi:predicted DCC family thiol-disulfide oxidoreductase YuxK